MLKFILDILRLEIKGLLMSTMNQLNSSIVEFYNYCLKQGGKLIKINLISFKYGFIFQF